MEQEKNIQEEQEQEEENEEFLDDDYYYTDVRTLLSWNSEGRPFKKRTKQFYLTALLIMLFTEIIFFLFSQYVLMFVVLALVFVSFSLASIPPKDFHYKVSTEGVRVEDHFYLWQELYDFYFKKVHGVETLRIRTKDFIPGELTLTLGDIDKDHVKQVLIHFLPFREYVKPTFMEKSGDWLAKNFPLEKTQ